MTEPIITSSNIVALWRLISVCARYEGIAIRDAIQIVRDSGMVEGALPADEGLKLGRHCRLLELDGDQNLILTEYSRLNLLAFCDTEEPNKFVIRGVLLKYLSIKNLDWLLFFNEDPELFKVSIPTEWIELLENGFLFDFEDDQVRDWWSRAFSRFQTYQEGKKLEIGKVAEKLTLDFEKDRLNTDGLSNDHTFVKWASQMSDKFGYDVLSIRGKFLRLSFSEKDQVQIEVKSSISESVNAFRFFVTKPEWKKALESIDSYYFYCWVSTKIESQSASGPFIIPARSLEHLIPKDIGSPVCEWSECRFIVDLNAHSMSCT